MSSKEEPVADLEAVIKRTRRIPFPLAEPGDVEDSRAEDGPTEQVEDRYFIPGRPFGKPGKPLSGASKARRISARFR